jgi:hypothetical protein
MGIATRTTETSIRVDSAIFGSIKIGNFQSLLAFPLIGI